MSPDPQRAAWREAITAFALVTAADAVLWQSRGFSEYTSAFIPLVFLAVPWWLLDRRRADWRAYALTASPVWPGVGLALGAAALVFPLFYAGFLVYYGTVCDWNLLPAMCQRFAGVGGGALRWPPDFAELALGHVVAVGLPEEFFFRGYLQGRLTETWPPTRRLLGAPVGRALLVSSALFAIGHVLVHGNPILLAVFFPALVFGWMRERTGSILAGTLFHAMCNLYSEVLHRSFFGQTR